MLVLLIWLGYLEKDFNLVLMEVNKLLQKQIEQKPTSKSAVASVSVDEGDIELF